MRDVIEIIARYLRTTHPLRMLWHLLWIFCVLAMLSVSYIITFHFTPVLDLWQRSRSMRHFGHELSTTIAIDQAVNQDLNSLMNSTQSQRAYLFRYHNGIASVNGVPFMFQSNTHEVIRPGVSRVIAFNQRLPSGINTNMNVEFAKRKCVSLADIDRNSDGAYYWYFQTRGSIGMIRCAVYTSDGDMIGFVGIDFLERQSLAYIKSKEAEVQLVAADISSILERRKNSGLK